MEQTGSFIPRQTRTTRAPVRQRRRIYLFSYFSYVLFFGTLLAVAGVFAFEFQANKSLAAQKELLAAERQNFSQADILRLEEFEARLNRAEQLLNNHAAVSELFTDLEEHTVADVQFSNLELERQAENEFIVRLQGNVDSFDPLLFQDQVLQSVEELGTYIISDVTYGSTEGAEEGSLPTGDQISFTIERTVPVSDIPFTPQVETEIESTQPSVVNEEPDINNES